MNPANTIAIIAVVLSCVGTASAARMLTGMNVKNGTLTSADLKNATLQLADFSAAARSQLRGAKGSTGSRGATGDKGPTGATGPIGAPGAPARVVSKWAWFDSHYLVTDGNNAGAADWDAYNSGNLNGLNLQFANTLSRPYERVLDLNSPGCGPEDVAGMHCAWGTNNGGAITINWNANITAVATLKILHRPSDLTPIHSRVQCHLSANSGTGTDFAKMGAKNGVSGYHDNQVETIQVVGSINKNATAPTEYMVQVECRDSDGTDGQTRYYVVGGSLSVVATERG